MPFTVPEVYANDEQNIQVIKEVHRQDHLSRYDGFLLKALCPPQKKKRVYRQKKLCCNPVV